MNMSPLQPTRVMMTGNVAAAETWLAAVLRGAEDVTAASAGLSVRIEAGTVRIDVPTRAPEATDDAVWFVGLRDAARILDRLELAEEEPMNKHLMIEQPDVLARPWPAAVHEVSAAELLRRLRHARRLEALGQMTSEVAHDFNNLLTVIMGYSRMLLARLEVSDPSHGDAREIVNAAERAASLTKQLLTFSRKRDVQPTALSLSAVAREAERVLAGMLGDKIELAIDVRDVPLIAADRGQIDQIIMNLITNARDAMPRGGRLTIQTGTFESYVVLTVTDTGCGMDAETQSRLFEPFFTTKKEGCGTGLGLAIIWDIVSQYGGLIKVESKPGQGSTFRICLPRIESEAEAKIVP